MQIRPALDSDWPQLWSIIQPIVRDGKTYAYDRTMSEQDAKRVWLALPRRTFICVEGDQVLGTYYLKTNHAGGGAHVCNCGYMVSQVARGKGVAGKLCAHSQQIAKQLGYLAMQFNFVVSSNEVAVRLWQKFGFDVVGTIPNAFNHPDLGYVDALVMYKELEQEV